MKPFIDDDFLLESDVARELYHGHAAKKAVIDYHCHIDPQTVAEDHEYENITELWLRGDHYKWRAMRANGVEERYCTGKDTSDYEKFERWAATVPYTMRNPLYHWAHLELKTAFGIDKTLSEETAREIWEECNEKLHTAGYTARGLLRRYHVECLCTTDDPTDDLSHHRKMRAEGGDIRMMPTWRPDKAMNIEDDGFADYVERLGEVADMDIKSFGDFVDALQKRHDYFAENGCRLSDHGVEEFYFEAYTDSQIDTIFAKARQGIRLSEQEKRQYKHCFLTVMAEMDADADWTQQYHYGALRNTNSVMYRQIGGDTGYDTIGEFSTARALYKFLNKINLKGKLTRTIIYPLNPCGNEMVAAMTGNFQEGCPGKMQMGAAWWFNDHYDGIRRQINALSAVSLLSRFVGMTTDSRSLLSYARHEYFRRLLCNIIGDDVCRGLLPDDRKALARMVEDIAYNNARAYFKLY